VAQVATEYPALFQLPGEGGTGDRKATGGQKHERGGGHYRQYDADSPQCKTEDSQRNENNLFQFLWSVVFHMLQIRIIPDFIIMVRFAMSMLLCYICNLQVFKEYA